MKVVFYILIIILIQGCSLSWTKAIQHGSVDNHNVNEAVDIEVEQNLIIIPVIINGREYRFILDTGAPFSISKEIQESVGFDIISTGSIIDSDNNRQRIEWAKVDSIYIGNVLFKNQTAFIADFEANPVLNCLGIDGIVGSNLMRQCNWIIDQELKALSIFDISENIKPDKSIAIPFSTDHQYNIFINIDIGPYVVKNVLVDYGSNGSIALSDEIFSTIANKDIFPVRYIEKGTKQSGIIGAPTKFERIITCSDSVSLDNLDLKSVLFKTGETVSIGNRLLSRFKVVLDWSNKYIYLSDYNEVPNTGFAGFRLGYSFENGYYIQAVTEGSSAYKAGVRQNMKVLKLDSLDFVNGHDLCDYARYKAGSKIYLQLSDSISIKDYYFEKTCFDQ